MAYGADDLANPHLEAALEKVGKATAAAGKAFVTWVPNPAKAAEWRRHGVTGFFVASEHAWMLAGARAVAADMKAL